MAYRPPNRRQREKAARLVEAMRRGKAAARMARPAPGMPPELPVLRRKVEITDFDCGQPTTHVMEFRRTRRVDVFDVWVDGVFWKQAGWSRALEGVRKAYPRVPSPRSDIWRWPSDLEESPLPADGLNPPKGEPIISAVEP